MSYEPNEFKCRTDRALDYFLDILKCKILSCHFGSLTYEAFDIFIVFPKAELHPPDKNPPYFSYPTITNFYFVR